jgi:hypothetical protein
MKINILYVFLLLIFCGCTNFKTEDLYGTWNFVSIKNEKGLKLSIQPEITLSFDNKGLYDYSSIVKNDEYAESGNYHIENKLIVLKNDESNATEKKLLIMKLEQDTLRLKMKNTAKDIQFLTLYRVKKMAMPSDTLTENIDSLEEAEMKALKVEKKRKK